jgi:hypothetical protein
MGGRVQCCAGLPPSSSPRRGENRYSRSKPRPRGGFCKIKSQNRCFCREAVPEECEAYPKGTGAVSTFIALGQPGAVDSRLGMR